MKNDRGQYFRPSWVRHWFLYLQQVKQMGTCIRRQVACVFVDEHHHEIATGFNGVAPGEPHCTEMYFSDDRRCPSDTVHGESTLDGCKATHAEMNAMFKMRDTYTHNDSGHDLGEDGFRSVMVKPMTLFTTLMPCVDCTANMISSLPNLKFIHALENYHSSVALGMLDELGIKYKVWNAMPLF